MAGTIRQAEPVRVRHMRHMAATCYNGGVTNPEWQKSSFCGTNACVEIANTPDGVLMRDSKHPDQEPLRFTPGGWAAFIGRIQAGEFAPASHTE